MPSRPTGERAQWRTATCEVCKKEFKTSRYDTTTCGPTCRSRKSRAEAQHRRQRADLVRALNVFARFTGRTPDEDDVDALKAIEAIARNTILGVQKQQRLVLEEVATILREPMPK